MKPEKSFAETLTDLALTIVLTAAGTMGAANEHTG